VALDVFTEQYVAYRVATEHAFGAAAVDRAAALVSLVNDAIEVELAWRRGVDVTAAEVAALGQHADQTSMAPQVLARVKAAFGTDTAAYQRLYLAPKVVTGKLRDWYAGNVDVQASVRAKAQAVWVAVEQGQSMQGRPRRRSSRSRLSSRRRQRRAGLRRRGTRSKRS
jgi:hypothetical protein